MQIQICTNCGQTVRNDAALCNHCGASTVERYIECESCKLKNPLERQLCMRCGASLSLDETQQKNYLDRFIRLLEQRIVHDHQDENIDECLKCFYDSPFHTTFLTATNQLALEAQSIRQTMVFQAAQEAQQLEQRRLVQLLDYFIIHYCGAFLKNPLPKAILKYQDLAEPPLFQMVLDYLALDSEPYPYYTDFIKMGMEQLKNASTHFLFPSKDEKIGVIVDLSETDSCKEGFAITEKAIYWKAPFEKAQSVTWSALESIQREQEWLLINGNFFNANISLNIKLLYCLRQMEVIYK